MKNLASERTRAGMSQEQLAERLSVARVTVARWESGSVMPRPEQLCRLSELFHCSIDYLFGLTEERVRR